MSDARLTSKAWLNAARDPVVATALESIFADAADAIAARGPACWASGRCCNFEATGHRLYTTGLEAAYTLVRAGSPGVESSTGVGGSSTQTGSSEQRAGSTPDLRPGLHPGVDGGGGTSANEPPARGRSHGSGSLETRGEDTGVRSGLSLPQIAAARERGGCPFQARNMCTVHAIKPVACRVYFCDRSAQEWQHDLAERLHERVRGLHEAHAIAYHYAEWRSLLEMLVDAKGGAAGGT